MCVWQITRQIYSSANLISSSFGSFGLQLAARRTLDAVLRRLRMPPLTVRPWVIPGAVLRYSGQLRRMAAGSILNIRNYYARRWVASHLKVVPGKIQR